ncbi:S8 family peptidase [Jidongwangia harbinensis]|uniref:S8 family peptidase n=1 Tax=Jidongwangia harbinensis TaxID=2878561 RepID=UPI001CD94FDC|nr:S8 family peptidase [Jidongwangia harbinensis]MCA2219254.1 S8 family peptidase [Jidongwangia harbinensis]
MRIIRAAAVVAAALTATTLAAGPVVAAPAVTLAPLLPAEGGKPNGSYLVVLKPGSSAGEDPVVTARNAGGHSVYRYRKVLTGFSAALSEQALTRVRANPNVAYVRADAVVQAIEDQPDARTVQPNPPSWGLDRIDQRALPLNNAFEYNTTGAGVTVFVADSGIRATHTDFGGRAQGVYNAVDDGRGAEDCHGHGTHVAGTIAGSSYGVAKSARIRAVRVLNCDNGGTNADLIEGMDWIAANAPANSVANFSLQGYGTEVNTAAERLIGTGVLAVFIGGNFNSDACSNAPRSTRGITVGATIRTDARWSSSNYGTCIDLFAPGHDITSAGIASDTAVAAGWQGTSMAAPHVTGWVARYLQTNPGATLAQAKAALLSAATTGALTNIGAGSPNRLLYAAPSF